MKIGNRSAMLKNYFKIAYRNIVKNKVPGIINILGFSLGISACFVIFLIVRFDLSFDSFHPDKDRVYRAVGNVDDFSGGKFHLSSFPYTSADFIRKQFTGVEKVATFFSYDATVTIPGGNNPTKKSGNGIVITEPDYFDIFPHRWLAGNKTSSLSQPFSVVLTESRVAEYFGPIPAISAMGREIVYNDSLRLRVTGIIEDWSGNSDFAYNDFISFSTVKSSFLQYTGDFQDIVQGKAWAMAPDNSQTFIMMAKGAGAARFDSQKAPLVAQVNASIHLGRDRKMGIELQPLSDIHFNAAYNDDRFRKAHLPTLYGLMGIAAFILLIAIINFINLSTAQSFQRAREIGIRKVLGSGRKALVFQFLAETFVLCVLAVILSLLLVNPLLYAFREFIAPGLSLNLKAPFLWVFTGAILLVTTLLAGFYPAKILSGYSPVQSLKGKGVQQANQKSYFRKGLIVFQFSLSLIFIIGTLVVGTQIHYMLNKDMGFKKDAIVLIPTKDEDSTAKKRLLTQRIRQLTGVDEVSLDGQQPAVSGSGDAAYLKRMKTGKEVLADRRVTGEQYVPLYGLKIIAGHNFAGPMNDSFPQFLINETGAQQLGFKKSEDAIGQSMQVGFLGYTGPAKPTGQIVGVLADFHTKSLYDPIGPVFLMSSNQFPRAVVSVKLATRGKQAYSFQATIAQIEKIWKEVNPDQSFEYTFYDEYLGKFYDKEQKTAEIVNAAMAIAVFISCMGLFGLVTFTAEQRTKEIGIRKILGASVGGIVTLLSKDLLKPVLLSFVIASPIAWYFSNKWLEGFSYRISFIWWIFALAAVVALAIAWLTVSLQAFRAATMDPVKSMRTE